MRVLVFVFTLLLLGCSEEQKMQIVARGDENRNPRLNELNPYAWNGLPMEIVVSDFQESDGIYSSFICDEINKRLSEDPLGSLHAFNAIENESRIYLFKICLSPEVGAPPEVLKAVSQYAKEYPDLVNEINSAANE
jgi:hypothetical protein